MNERIKELAAQAVQLVADEHTNGDESRLNTNSYHVKDLINEKFAELLIKECANKFDEMAEREIALLPARDACGEFEDLAWKAMNDGMILAWESAGDHLLDHFGVEE